MQGPGRAWLLHAEPRGSLGRLRTPPHLPHHSNRVQDGRQVEKNSTIIFELVTNKTCEKEIYLSKGTFTIRTYIGRPEDDKEKRRVCLHTSRDRMARSIWANESKLKLFSLDPLRHEVPAAEAGTDPEDIQLRRRLPRQGGGQFRSARGMETSATGGGAPALRDRNDHDAPLVVGATLPDKQDRVGLLGGTLVANG